MASGTIIEDKEDIERVYFGLALEIQKQMTSTLYNPKKKVIVIAGPTGCGKTALSLMLANAIGGEIISADSMQVYRGMDIGTAKATVKERAEVPHHMLDIRHVTENFNVVDFYYEARQSCQLVLGRDNIPIIVGGSGFYIHSLIYGPPSGPPSIPEVRKALENEILNLGADVLYERLKQLDPQYASTITKHDQQKIVRALEIITLTGKKVSKLSWVKRVRPQNYDFHCWFLTRSRESIYQRIDKRCEKMLEDGFLEEVERLDKEGIRTNTSASQAIGYRQALDFLATSRSPEEYHRFVESFKQASRHYAKRQMTWFRPPREPLFRSLDLELHGCEDAIKIIRKDYKA